MYVGWETEKLNEFNVELLYKRRQKQKKTEITPKGEHCMAWHVREREGTRASAWRRTHIQTHTHRHNYKRSRRRRRKKIKSQYVQPNQSEEQNLMHTQFKRLRFACYLFFIHAFIIIHIKNYINSTNFSDSKNYVPAVYRRHMRLHFALLISFFFSCARTQIQLANETRKAKAERQRRWPLICQRVKERYRERRQAESEWKLIVGPTGCAARIII